jgi:hypothetical protein
MRWRRFWGASMFPTGNDNVRVATNPALRGFAAVAQSGWSHRPRVRSEIDSGSNGRGLPGSSWASSAWPNQVKGQVRLVGVHRMTWRSCQVGMATFVSTFIPPMWEPCSSAACR